VDKIRWHKLGWAKSSDSTLDDLQVILGKSERVAHALQATHIAVLLIGHVSLLADDVKGPIAVNL
jgi:hypothetical protein